MPNPKDFFDDLVPVLIISVVAILGFVILSAPPPREAAATTYIIVSNGD